MLGNFTKEQLDRAKVVLEGLKATKFAFNAHKHKCDNFSFRDVADHLDDEKKEFDYYRDTKNITDLDGRRVLLELADMSNCIDLMVMKLLEE
jgi:hypothetical protein